jgi:hypothetical protein
MHTVGRSITDRMKGAAMLDIATYEEVEADESATSQAGIVVAIVAVSSGIGAWNLGLGAVFGGLIAAILGWLIWAGITYVIGDKVFGGTATWGELLRTLGFAQSPGILYILAILPLIGWLVRFAVGIWILIAGIIAIRQALDFSTGKAVLTALIGWVVVFVGALLLGSLFN